MDMHMWLRSVSKDITNLSLSISKRARCDAVKLRSLRFHDHGNAAGTDRFLDGESDLLGEPFLDLESAGKGLGDARELGQAENQLVGDVSDGDLGESVGLQSHIVGRGEVTRWMPRRTDLAGKRHEMVLAKTEHVDIPDDDHLFVVLREHRIVDDVHEPLLVSLCHPHEGLGVSLGRAQKPLPIGILADTLEDGADGEGELGEVLLLLRRGEVEAFLGGLGYGRETSAGGPSKTTRVVERWYVLTGPTETFLVCDTRAIHIKSHAMLDQLVSDLGSELIHVPPIREVVRLILVVLVRGHRPRPQRDVWERRERARGRGSRGSRAGRGGGTRGGPEAVPLPLLSGVERRVRMTRVGETEIDLVRPGSGVRPRSRRRRSEQ
jgi:hypothetical protein